MLERLFPDRFDDRYEGQRAALWLLALLLALKLVMSLNSIFNTASVASGGDGFPLESYGTDGARAVLMLFALTALGQLALALVGFGALIRYRAMVPFVFLLLFAEHGARRFIVGSHAIERSQAAPVGFYVNMVLLALLLLGLVLSLWPRRAAVPDSPLPEGWTKP